MVCFVSETDMLVVLSLLRPLLYDKFHMTDLYDDLTDYFYNI